MTPLPKESEQHDEEGDKNLSTSTPSTCDTNHQFQDLEEKEPVETPKGTCYLSSNSNEEKSPDDLNLPRRVQSTHSLLGLVGLEGHEESDDEISIGDISVVTEEQEVMDIEVSPTTTSSPIENENFEDRTCNTTPPGSVQGPAILSLSPPRLTTYSVGSVTSASVTESFVLQPRPIQSTQRQNHLPHESLRFPPSPKGQQSQLQSQPKPRSRPPRAPHHHPANPSGNNSVSGGPLLVPRAIMGGPDSASSVSGRGHKRTSTDATNYSFLSALTDASGGEYTAPRRRTLSWDQNGDSKRGGNAAESKSLSGQPTSGSILQPILLPGDLDSRPPMSISTTNLQMPIAPVPSATTPTRPQSKNTLLPPPSSLPARENLHPLIQKLQQNVSHTKNTSFISPPSHSKENNNIHPLIRKLQESSPSKSGHTTLLTSPSTPFTVHIQDEKKDDDSSNSHRMKQQKPQHTRKPSDYGSFSSSFCSSSTVKLQKKTYTSPDGSRGAFSSPRTISENSATGDSRNKKFDLVDITKGTKEGSVETEILDCIEQSNSIADEKKKYEEQFPFSSWPYLLVAWGISRLGNLENVASKSSVALLSRNIAQFCLLFGAAALLKRRLSKKFRHRQIIGQCWDDFSRLKSIWAVLNEISLLASKKLEDEPKDAETHNVPFCTIDQQFHDIMDWDDNSLFRKDKLTREVVAESAQTVYEAFIQCNDKGELSFESIINMIKLSDGAANRSKVKVLSDLLCPSRQGRISKFDFMKSIDSIAKATIYLEANIRNTSQICDNVEHLVDNLFYTIVLILAPSVIGVEMSALVLTILIGSMSFVFVNYVLSAENLNGIIRIITQKSYGIGDRVCFVPKGIESNVCDGPPSGGWIVEDIDLYKTTLRQGITGERTTSPNSALLSNSRVVNWKHWHNAVVSLSMEFPGNIEGEQIDLIRSHISEWIETHSHEWTSLESFRMMDTDIHQKHVKYELVLRHRESWHNYAVVQDSKSDILFFLRQLQKA